MKKTLITFVLATAISMLAFKAYAWQSTKPLSESNLIDLLGSYVPPGRVAELATKKGIDFELTPDRENELLKAGANAELIATLRSLAAKPAPRADGKERAAKALAHPVSQRTYRQGRCE